VLRHFTVDGAGVSTGAAGVSSIVLDDLVVRGGRCWGVAIVGPMMEVKNSLITGNGADPTCPSPPGAGLYVAANQVTYADYAPSIHDNEIAGNTGPGVDIYNVGRGVFRSNNVHDNSGWAGFSLLGSNWTVDQNTIRHPTTGGGQPWIPSCSSGPSGPKSAAIFLCRDTSANGLTTASNAITNNTASSYYGILLIGNDPAVPRNNTLTGNTVTGTVKCADDNKRSGPTANSWSPKDCSPVYF
jgi:parallel beta-helix repeat protein